MPTIDPSAGSSLHARAGATVSGSGPGASSGRRCGSADGCVLDSMVVVDGPTEIGPRCRFHHGAVVGTAPQDLKYTGARSAVCDRRGQRLPRVQHRQPRHRRGGADRHRAADNLVMAYAHVAHNCRARRSRHPRQLRESGRARRRSATGRSSAASPRCTSSSRSAPRIIGGGSRVPMDVAALRQGGREPAARLPGSTRSACSGAGSARRSRDECGSSIGSSSGRICSCRGGGDDPERVRPLPEIELFCRFVERVGARAHR